MKISFKIICCLTILLIVLQACLDNSKKIVIEQPPYISKQDVKIDTDSSFYDSIVKKISIPRFIVLNEDNETMYSDIDKVLCYSDKYYILDKTGCRVVVSFLSDGKPFRKYGDVGQGPGEYTCPWDIDVDSEHLYILDSNEKKIIQYSVDGNFIKEWKLPFYADAFKKLDNGNFLFNILPNGDTGAQICISDSSISNFKYYLRYDKDYLGGLLTNNIFRKGLMPKSSIYFRASLDTMYLINSNGIPNKTISFDFQDKGLSKRAKNDFIAERKDGKNRINYAFRFGDTPIPIAENLWLGVIYNDKEQYTIIFDSETNRCGGRKFGTHSSIYDINEPVGCDGNGNIIGILDIDIANECYDFSNLDENLKKSLKDGNRIITLHKLNLK